MDIDLQRKWLLNNNEFIYLIKKGCLNKTAFFFEKNRRFAFYNKYN